jgi:BNR repeat-like domain
MKSKLSHFSFLTVLFCIGSLGCSSTAILPESKQHADSLANKSYPIYAKSSFGLLEVNSFDVYADKQSIHLLIAGPTTINNQRMSIRYTRSEDGGKHWLRPVDLGVTSPQPLASRGNDVQVATSNNNIVAAWQATGGIPGMGSLVTAFSSDGGKTWQMGGNPAANNQGDQSHIDLTADGHGYFHSVWLEDPEENGYQSLRYAKSLDGGKVWQTSATLDDSTCSCCWNTLKVTRQNQLKILYRDMEPRDMRLLQSADSGSSWVSVNKVGDFGWKFDGCPHVGGSLTFDSIDGAKGLHSLVWTGAENKQGLYYLRSVDEGKTWSSPKRVGNNAIHGDVATNKNELVSVWDEMEPEGSSIFYSKSLDGGLTWVTAQRLSSMGIMATHPRLVATQFGYLSIWTEKQTKQLSQIAFSILE